MTNEKEKDTAEAYPEFGQTPRYIPTGGGKVADLSGMAKPLSFAERLRMRRADLEVELAKVDEAIGILKANPGVDGILRIMARTGVL